MFKYSIFFSATRIDYWLSGEFNVVKCFLNIKCLKCVVNNKQPQKCHCPISARSMNGWVVQRGYENLQTKHIMWYIVVTSNVLFQIFSRSNFVVWLSSNLVATNGWRFLIHCINLHPKRLFSSVVNEFVFRHEQSYFPTWIPPVVENANS